MAIARRMGCGKKIVIGDKRKENADAIAKIMNDEYTYNRLRFFGITQQIKKVTNKGDYYHEKKFWSENLDVSAAGADCRQL